MGRLEIGKTGKSGRMGDGGKRLEASGARREVGRLRDVERWEIGRLGKKAATHYPILATGYF
jgi:hypothetical protein